MNRDFSYPLRVASDKFGARTAFIHRGRRWTFDEVDRATDRLAAAFERGGVTGEKVLVLLQNEPLAVLTYLALARAGGVSVPVNPKLLPHEIAFILQDSGATAIVADDAFCATARELVASHEIAHLFTANAASAVAGEDRLEDLLDQPGTPTTVVDAGSEASIVYTSGTSGFPKGVVRSHDANLWTTVNSLLGQHRSPEDVELFVLPLFGIAFLFQVMPLMLAGGTVVLDGGFDPHRTWELIEEHQVTRIFLAPTMIDSLLTVDGHEGRDASSLRVLNTAYEFPERIRRAAETRFGPIIAYMYGLTEAQLCVSTPEEFAQDPTNAGHAMGLMRVKVFDEHRAPVPAGETGEIALSGPSLMSGYHGQDELTAESLHDGWLFTGDLGHVDEHGRIHVSGRKKEIIKTGGFTVDPVEVENVLLGFPGVLEAAVVGVPDEHWGERTVAFLVTSEPVPEDALRIFVKERVSSYKAPKQLVFVTGLPRTPTGKVQRGQLRNQVQQTAPPGQ